MKNEVKKAQIIMDEFNEMPSEQKEKIKKFIIANEILVAQEIYDDLLKAKKLKYLGLGARITFLAKQIDEKSEVQR